MANFSSATAKSLYIFIFAITCLSTGCTTVIKPQGDWYPKKDLKLTADDFKDLQIHLECGVGNFNNKNWTVVFNKACRDIEKSLKVYQIPVTTSKTREQSSTKQPPRKHTLYLTYIDRGASSDYGGWTMLPFIFSFGYLPLVIDNELKGELIIEDSFKNTLHRETIRAESTEFVAWVAFFVANHPKKNKASFAFSDSLVNHILNLTYTQHKKGLVL